MRTATCHKYQGDAGRRARYAELIAVLRAFPANKDKWDAITETAADLPPHLLPELFDVVARTAPDAFIGKGEAIAALVAACGFFPGLRGNLQALCSGTCCPVFRGQGSSSSSSSQLP